MPNGDPQDTSKKKDSGSTAPSGFASKTLPSGETAYFPDDQTNDQINSTVKQLPDYSLSPESKASQWVWTPKVSQEDAAKFWANTLFGTDVEGKPIGTKKDEPPSRVAKIGSDILGGITSGMTAPGQIVLTVSGLGEWAFGKEAARDAIPLAKSLQPLLKMPGRAAAAYFGLQGLGAMLGNRKEGETDDQLLERRILGATAFLGTAHATVMGANEALGKVLTTTFGLDEDLAGKVQARVAQLEKARSTRDDTVSSIETERDAKLGNLDQSTRRTIAQLEHQLDETNKLVRSTSGDKSLAIDNIARESLDASKGKLSDLQRDQFHQGSRIIAETVQAIREMEGDRDVEGSIKKPFREIGEKIKAPVSDASTIRGIVAAELKSRNANPDELPAAALRALGKEESEGSDSDRIPLDTSRFIGEPPDLGSDTAGVSFNQMTRVREDLYNAADNAKDSSIKGALMASYEKVTDLQEKAAADAGQGAAYGKAKADFMKFKRGLGSGMMRTWLAAEDVQHQDMQAKVSRLIAEDDRKTNGAITRAIRTTLKSAVIDTGPLDDVSKQIAVREEVPKRIASNVKAMKGQLVEDRKLGSIQLKAGTKEKIDQARGLSKEQSDAIDKEYKGKITAAQDEFREQEHSIDRHQIIPRYETAELAGKGNEELYRTKLREMAERENGKGIQITPIVMALYGVMHASAFPFLYGMARGGIPELVKNPSFQDWIIQRAGVSPKTPQANMLRRAIAGMGPTLRRLEKSGVPQAAAMHSVPTRDKGDTPPTREDVASQP